MNIDLDGLEGVPSIFTGTATVGKSTGLVSAGSNLTNVVVHGTTAVKAAGVSLKLGKAAFSLAVDATRVVTNTKLNLPSSQQRTKSHIASWIERISSGDGSYQDYGIVFTGNSNGTMELKDHAGNIIDAVDVGDIMNIFKAWKSIKGVTGFPSMMDLLKDAAAANPKLKKLVEALEKIEELREIHDKIDESVEMTEKLKEAEETSKENSSNDPMLIKFKQPDGSYQYQDFDGNYSSGAIRERKGKTIDTLKWNRAKNKMDTTKTVEPIK
jgi:hypothetical protein